MSASDLNIPNLDKLIAHLGAQPPEAINMAEVQVIPRPDCATCGCIIGHAELVWGRGYPRYSLEEKVFGGVCDSITWNALVRPAGWDKEVEGGRRYPAHRVIATLKRLRDHYLATGEVVVDWGAEPTEGQPWVAPQVTELVDRRLPDEITSLLSQKACASTELLR